MQAKLIDTHCHLDFDVFDTDRTQVLQRAEENGICDIIIPGTQKIYWDRVRDLCDKHDQLHACYGLHPYWVNNHKKADTERLEEYIHTHSPVAVGECGLDFRAEQADKKQQLYFFEAQLATADNMNLPVVIHSVKATDDVIKTIKKFKNLSGMIHSYSGSSEQARQLIDLNFLISISGSATFENAKKIKEVIRKIPLSAMLVETDAPDQPDARHLGNRNEPAFLINTVKLIAEQRQEEEDLVRRQTTENAIRLFKLNRPQ